MKTRDNAYCGLFGGMAIALPMLFHAFGFVGAMFLPMYWPLIALAFLTSIPRATATAAIVPLVSSILTGMPLMFPPLVAVVSIELAVQIALIGLFARSRGVRGTFVVLAVILVFGRFIHTALVYLLSMCFELPPHMIAGISFLAGWPGIALMIVTLPFFAGAIGRRDGVCEVRFLKALRFMHLPEGAVLLLAQILRWFEALARDAETLARAAEMRRGASAGDNHERSDQPPVTIENLRACYPGRSEAALELESFIARKGEKIALLGANGSGKTTLLAAIAGFIKCEGSIKVVGRNRISYLFENPDDLFLFPTLREDVGYALTKKGLSADDISRRIDELLSAVGLGTGNRPVASLSRGQRQRAALAALLAAEPELLLLDEPTAALDDAEKLRLAELIRSLPSTVIIATHDRAFAASACGREVSLP